MNILGDGLEAPRPSNSLYVLLETHPDSRAVYAIPHDLYLILDTSAYRSPDCDTFKWRWPIRSHHAFGMSGKVAWSIILCDEI